ncbi:MAG: ABC transporter permease subunit [Spirochaetia bacterium]|jgi:putative aldouronate transport system permease protein
MAIMQPRVFSIRLHRTVQREGQIWLICLPIIAWAVVFCYLPIYGIATAFIQYVPGKPIMRSPWVGLQYFAEFFKNPEFGMIMRNTLAIGGLNILFGFPAPIILALLINELSQGPFKKVVQTVSYVPYFVSWVVMASLIFALLGSEGLLNKLLLSLHLTERSILFLGEGKYFWGIIVIANIWKGIGWSSIIYLSAIAGIDQELYQAGAVDGLGRAGMAWHIILPGIRATILLLFILQMGDILNAGFEQQLLLGTPQTRSFYEVIETYAYRYGIQMGRYAFGTAVEFMKSIIGLGLVFSLNSLFRRTVKISVV